MGLVYDTASAQVVQVVKLDVSLDIILTEIDKNWKSTTPTTDSCHSRGAGINKIFILNPTVVVKLLQYSGLGSNIGMGFRCTNDLQ